MCSIAKIGGCGDYLTFVKFLSTNEEDGLQNNKVVGANSIDEERSTKSPFYKV